jgi:hypothetical protein
VLKLPPKESYNKKEGSCVMVLAKPNLVRIIAMMHMLRLKHWETYYTKNSCGAFSMLIKNIY